MNSRQIKVLSEYLECFSTLLIDDWQGEKVFSGTFLGRDYDKSVYFLTRE